MSEPKPEIPTTVVANAIGMAAVVRALADDIDRTSPHLFREINLSPGAMAIYRQIIDAPDPLTDPLVDAIRAGQVGWSITADLDRQRRWLAEYRLATGPMRSFLAPVLDEPRDALPRILLGEAIQEFGWDRPATGGAVMASECLWAPEGRWSILRGVLRWHARGRPVADVARVAVPEYLYVRENLKPDLMPDCFSCRGPSGPPWGERLDFVRCPCRGVRPAKCSACGVGRPGWRWLCPGCRIDKGVRFDLAKARTNPDRYRRILEYEREREFLPPDDRYSDGRERPQGLSMDDM